MINTRLRVIGTIVLLLFAACSQGVVPPVNAQSVQQIYNPPSQQISAGSGSTSMAVFPGIGYYTTCQVTVTGTWSGTITFEEVGQDGTTWQPVKGQDAAQVASGTTTTSNVTWNFPCASALQFRARFSSYSSGSANIALLASTGNAVATGSSGGGASPVPSLPPDTLPATPTPSPAPSQLYPNTSYNKAQGSTGWWPFIFCDKTSPISTTSSGFTNVVSAVSAEKIYVCSISLVAAGTVSAKFAQGTTSSTACDTSEADITGAYPLSTSSGLAQSSAFTPLWIGTAGDQLCINLGASVGVYGFVTYAQM